MVRVLGQGQVNRCVVRVVEVGSGLVGWCQGSMGVVGVVGVGSG